jgi:hypothetical protein
LGGVKAKKNKSAQENAPLELKDAVAPFRVPAIENPPMVRTQIYLSRAEYDFLNAEARRRDQPMAAVLRSIIDEKMRVPDEVWENNPLLQPPIDDPDYQPRGDGVVNHDHYVYGGEKKYKKLKGKWVLQPPLE